MSLDIMEGEVPINPDPDNPYGTLSNFEIDKKIGKGQFSEVWRARCKIDGSIVALKKVQVNWDVFFRTTVSSYV